MSTSEAAATADTAAAAPQVAEVDNHLKRKSSDIGWEWGRLCDPNDKNRTESSVFFVDKRAQQEFIALSSILLMLAHLL